MRRSKIRQVGRRTPEIVEPWAKQTRHRNSGRIAFIQGGGSEIEWTTHMLSGAVAGYAVTSDWKGAMVGGIAGVVPDLDEPKSKFGKVIPFVSIPLNKLFGHRTLTHSLLFAALTGLSLWPFIGQPYAFVAALGILAHIVGDMLTGRVQLLYPKREWVGTSVSRFGFFFMDRFVRIGLILWVFVVAGQNILT